MFAATLIAVIIGGSIVALIASGWSLSYAASGTFNVAHPVAVVAGPSAMALLAASGHPWWTSLAGGIACGGLAGVAVDRIVLSPTRAESGDPRDPNRALIAGAAMLAFVGSIAGAWPLDISQPAGARRVLLAGASIPLPTIAVAVLCVVAVAAALGLLRSTRFGIVVRAVASDAPAARAAGVGVERVIASAAFVASSLAALAGIALALAASAIGGHANAASVTGVVLAALAAVVWSGRSSPAGAVAVSFALAVAWSAGAGDRIGLVGVVLAETILILIATAGLTGRRLPGQLRPPETA